MKTEWLEADVLECEDGLFLLIVAGEEVGEYETRAEAEAAMIRECCPWASRVEPMDRGRYRYKAIR